MEPGNKLPLDELAQLSYDNGLLMFGVLPLVLIAILVVVGVSLYYWRKAKGWNDLGVAMRLNDDVMPDEPPFSTKRKLEKTASTPASPRITKIGPKPPARPLN